MTTNGTVKPSTSGFGTTQSLIPAAELERRKVLLKFE
jgi:hypothetical protein